MIIVLLQALWILLSGDGRDISLSSKQSLRERNQMINPQYIHSAMRKTSKFIAAICKFYDGIFFVEKLDTINYYDKSGVWNYLFYVGALF